MGGGGRGGAPAGIPGAPNIDAHSDNSGIYLETLTNMMENLSKENTRKKGHRLAAFRERFIRRSADDLFQIYRLLLPHVRGLLHG